MTNYANGAVLERAAAGELAGNGYHTVRAAGSHGPADVVALKRGEVLLVQCKRDGYLTPGGRAELVALAHRVGGVPLVASWGKHGNAARFVLFRELVPVLTGGPEYQLWSPDHGLGREDGRRTG